MKNPYDLDLSAFEATYEGFADEHYCFRLNLRKHTGLSVVMYQAKVSEWLFNNTHGKWYMGNSFPYKDYPNVSLYNKGNNDYFVLLQFLPDVVAFEQEFEVSGITPSMLVP